jgi:ferric-dicitrate binding protein FerR (iron transport regulator)
MKAPRYARLIAEVWKRGEPRPMAMRAHSNRDEEIALIEQAMDRKRRSARTLRQATYWAVAATVLIAGMWRANREPFVAPATSAKPDPNDATSGTAPVVIAIASGGGSVVGAPGSATPAVPGRALRAGSRLIVDPSAGATLSLSTGTHLEVEHGSQLTVVEDGRAQVFALSAGALHADVAKLGNGERFIVRTPDAEVEVRGTSFLVSVVGGDPQCGGGSTTRVAVTEGAVTVRSHEHEETVRAGERWPRGCRPAGTPSPAANVVPKRAARLETHPVPLAAEIAPLPPSASAHAAIAARHTPSSTLAEENDLFAEGMVARRSRQLPLALDKMDRFLDKYPSSHLAENAAVERMRLLRVLDPMKATAAAREYLQRHPNGFARADAEAIVGTKR